MCLITRNGEAQKIQGIKKPSVETPGLNLCYKK